MEIITNPSIPFWSHIPEGTDVGTVIKIDGHIHHHFDWFSIDLMCGHEISHQNSIALHFNPRHYESCVVLNSRQYQEWGHEERKHHDWHAFHRGNRFTITIHVEPEYFRINVNGNHFANFYHRVLFDVKSLRIDGDVRINYIEYMRENPMVSVTHPTYPYAYVPPSHYTHNRYYLPESAQPIEEAVTPTRLI